MCLLVWGIDTRNTFVDHLIRKGIFTFKDDERLQKGELISPQLAQAIKDSRISIVVFSKDYASSSWCLDEMATIVECHQQLNQTVIPVFYDVDPSHVRKQNGVYENAFVLHDEKFQQDPSKVDRWKSAMKNLANLAGFDVRNRPESTTIQNIVQGVIKKLNPKFLWSTEDIIGIQPRVEELGKLLKLSSANNDFRVLGILGMVGIGKTTHATVLYDKISYGFDASCFIENVSRIYRDGGSIAVQKQIFHQTLGEINLEAYSPSEISGIVRHRLHNIKVLIVLDNVDQLEQLQELAIDPKLLHTESRMIITTRDEHILRVYEADEIYKVPLLNKNDAYQLFCKRAFKSEEQSSSCAELIPEVLKYARGLPLAIKVIGSSLCTRDATQWKDVLDRLENSPNKEIMDVLEISVEGLQYEDREIFLQIACFFKGEREEYVRRILDACLLNPRIGIQNLIEKSLITIKNEEIHMHEMLQKLGGKIVRHKCPDEPELWSRVWHYEDFHRLLMTETGTIKVKAIVLNKKEEVFECEAQQLSKLRLPCLKRMDLSNSKFLIETPNFEGVIALERLDLTGCTSLCHVHPSIGSLSKLAFLSFQNCSNLEAIDFGRVCNLCSLRVLRLSGCSKLENTPDFTGASSNLEYLDIDGCTSLSLVHESIGALTKLRFLGMRDCIDLVSIPSNINTMTSLTTLDFYGCSKLGNLPLISAVSSSSNLKPLISLDLSFCDLHAVPDAIGELSCLERLNLQGNKFISLPHAIFELSCLAYLNLSHCHELESLPILPTTSASSVGRYFTTTSGSRDHQLKSLPQLRRESDTSKVGRYFTTISRSRDHQLKSLPQLRRESDTSKVGRYFTTTSGSRDHRSGFYIFDCPKVVYQVIRPQFKWLTRLLKVPRHFRCGFDMVSPYQHRKDTYFKGNPLIETWFDHIFRGDSKIRVVHCDVDENWIGFLFSVEFEAEYPSTISSCRHHSSSSPLPHPFYLSFETECTEQRFDMPLNLELDKIHGSPHIWTIYISRKHCHFIETGAHITFRACPGLVVKNWGLRRVVKQDIDVLERILRGIIFAPSCNKEDLVIENVDKSSSSSNSSYGPKIQLPYNWLVTEEDEVENLEAKAKENNLSNLGL